MFNHHQDAALHTPTAGQVIIQSNSDVLSGYILGMTYVEVRYFPFHKCLQCNCIFFKLNQISLEDRTTLTKI